MIVWKKSQPQAKGYSEAGASLTRRALKSFRPNSGSPSDDINRNNFTLRQRARMLYMASPVATAAINTNRTKVVGTGLTMRSTIDRDTLGAAPEAAKAWQKQAEAEWRLWCKKQNCDALGLNSFAGLQQLVMKSWLMSGDVFVLIKRATATPLNPYTMRLHVIEADRVSTPAEYGGGLTVSGFTEGKVPEGKPGAGNKIYDGVEVDESGHVVAYYISNVYPLQVTSEVPKWTRVEAYGRKTGLPNILHIVDSERPDQYRGVPYLAQVIEPLLQLRRYTESELMAALVQSFFTAWIQTETNPAAVPFGEVGAGDIAGVPSSNPDDTNPEDNISNDPNEYEMGPGTVAHLAPGETIAFGNPNIPTAGFETFVKTLCRLVGSALELPYDVLVKEFNSSYSASRGALLEAWEAFKMRRAWLVEDFCQPVYELFIAEAVALGRIKAPGFFSDLLVREAWCGTRWIGPVQGSLDPKKEAEAALLLVDQAIKTHDQVTREMSSGDWEENVEQLARENELLKTAGGQQVTVVQSEPPDGDGGDGDGSDEPPQNNQGGNQT
ncbi:phage portal protein [uncultured Dysosmobacter sp.]|uniref:phage portal protein n=1 Tax=uncultured Dysosmobacter sp. TaxID=2591384 RepID=UPI002629860A|nr:phage portal protein [uncultured Dysosmobacter sp.]